jgi:hypothetical protein
VYLIVIGADVKKGATVDVTLLVPEVGVVVDGLQDAQQSIGTNGQIYGALATISAHVQPLVNTDPNLSPYRQESVN